jgi:hypothetical protein
MSPRFETPPERIAALHAIRDRYQGLAGATQAARLHGALQELGSVTTFECSRFLDIYDPRPRVHYLRRMGHRIITIMEDHFTEAGLRHRLGRYLLVREVGYAQ